MSVKPGGPRKDVFFPIQSVTFRKDELDFILDILATNLRDSMIQFGNSAHFTLHLDLQVHRPGQKKKPCPKINPKTPIPTPPPTGTPDGKLSD